MTRANVFFKGLEKYWELKEKEIILVSMYGEIIESENT